MEAAAGPGPAQFTCVTCHVAFRTADDQRSHYKTDWHRYNLKRKVAGMVPVSRTDFNNRVLAQQAKEQREAEQAKYSGHCDVCKKTYATENAFNNHLLSNRHRENAAKAAAGPVAAAVDGEDGEDAEEEDAGEDGSMQTDAPVAAAPTEAAADAAASAAPAVSAPADAEAFAAAAGAVVASVGEAPASADAGRRGIRPEVLGRFATQLSALATTAEPGQELSEADELALIDAKIANARYLKLSECLFCLKDSTTLDRNVQHMAREHSFFLPDLEYLVDLPGMMQYLGEKVSVGNICLHCNGRGRAFHSLEAVQKHMLDKGHCKLWYEGDAELEYSDFYDFRASYPDNDGTEELRAEDEKSGAVLAEDETELILPSGSRLGHRAFNRYYKQKFPLPEVRDSVVVTKMMSEYRALGWEKQAPAVKRDQQTYQRRVAAWQMKVGVRANKLQEYFRPQVIF